MFTDFLATLSLDTLQELRLSDGGDGVDIGLETMKMISDLPSIRKIVFDKLGIRPGVWPQGMNDWERHTAEYLNAIQTYANENNYDIEYDIHDGDVSSYDYEDETETDEDTGEEETDE